MQDTPQPVKKRPNLLLIGAQKSGTTSIATALGAHKRVFLPVEKELNFFSRPNWAEDLDAYQKRFKDHPAVQYWMDATPGYMWTRTAYGRELGERSPMKHDVPEAIRDTLGTDIRLIAIMRHPVRRAVSSFFHQFRMGRLSTGERIRDMGHRHGIVDLGFYSEHLERYAAVFPQENIKTLFFEYYMHNTELVHRDLMYWLDLDPTEMGKPTPDANEGMKLSYSSDCISVKNGMQQVRELAGHANYKRMKLIEPPIVEQADLDFLNDIYADELERMAQAYPETVEIWPRRLTLEAYSSRARNLGNVDYQLSEQTRTAETLSSQINRLLSTHREVRNALEHKAIALETLRERLSKMDVSRKRRINELEEMANLLHKQEMRHSEAIESLERKLAESQKNVTALKNKLAAQAKDGQADASS